MSALRKLEVRIEDQLVGIVAETPGREIYFEYSPEWLRGGYSLSPFFLPLAAGVKREESHIFDGLFGVFDDSLPDGWGLLLMDRFFRAKGIAPESLSPLDRLAYIGDQSVGALRYRPAMPDVGAPAQGEVDLGFVGAQAERIVAGSPEEALPALYAGGGSFAGSRPKVFVAYNPATHQLSSDLVSANPGSSQWLVKFRAREDPSDAGCIEHAYAQMAREAGIRMPPTRLFDTPIGQFFGIERFDRTTSGLRVHTHTFGGMVHSHFRHPNRDYSELLALVLTVTRDMSEVEQAFRRAVFNVFAHNRDDHVKNHAFVRNPEGSWRLSPAYDLTFSAGVRGQHNMTILGSPAPGVDELMRLSADAGIHRTTAKQVVDDVAASVKRWPQFAERAGVTNASMSLVQKNLLSELS